MPITGGKGNGAEGIDEGIIRNRVVEKFVVPKLPAPPQVRVFDVNVRRPRNFLLEAAAPSPPDEAVDLDGPPDVRPPQQPEVRPNLPNSVLKRENFDRWVFSDGVFEVGPRQHLDALVRQRIESFSRTHALTAAQEAKLRLAGQGDIKRFLDRVEARRREFEAARMDLNLGMQFLATLGPLRQEFEEGPFGDGSLFAKTLRKIENDARAARPSGIE
jgi:hypothetical protein